MLSQFFIPYIRQAFICDDHVDTAKAGYDVIGGIKELGMICNQIMLS